MLSKNYTKQIKERINAFGYGNVFVIADFSDIADYENLKKVLLRLENDRTIRRIIRGVYEYPEYSDFLKEYVAPSPNKVAQALARNNGWTIVPCGDTALNMLGLSTQVPAIWSYVSDGTYKSYEYDKVHIIFKRTTNKEISKLSYKTALVIQALKTFGKENINEKTITKLANVLTAEEKAIMLTETKYTTAWIYEVIKAICNRGDDDA